MYYNISFFVLSLSFFLFCAAAGAQSPSKNPLEITDVYASYSDSPIVIDGKADEPVWSKAKSYSFCTPLYQSQKGGVPQQGASVRYAYDEKYFYVFAELTDDDIFQYSKNNNELHSESGDLLEVFLWPSKNTWYWEFYGTPNNLNSAIFYPGHGRLLAKHCFVKDSGVKAASVVNGTLDDWKDKDISFTVELAIPVSELTKHGDRFDNDSDWRILSARYNYSRYLEYTEFSTHPQLSRGDFHWRRGYARLRFEK